MSRWRALTGLGPWWLVAAVAVVGLGGVVSGHIRGGGYVFAAGVALAALMRAVLPVPRGGGLEIRSRWLDVVMLLVVATALVVVFASVRVVVGPAR
ncbi:MAG: DUF3017 domain-containing protein [Actinomycetota bacterium]|nr:DUF3017 domain-containing protein [Actinomycetota bacterium]